MCSSRRIEPAMHVGDESEQVERVLLRDWPVDARCVRGRVPKRPKEADDKVDEACLLRSVGVVTKPVDSEVRLLAAEGALHQGCAIPL